MEVHACGYRLAAILYTVDSRALDVSFWDPLSCCWTAPSCTRDSWAIERPGTTMSFLGLTMNAVSIRAPSPTTEYFSLCLYDLTPYLHTKRGGQVRRALFDLCNPFLTELSCKAGQRSRNVKQNNNQRHSSIWPFCSKAET